MACWVLAQIYDLQTFTIVCFSETITLEEYYRLNVFNGELAGERR